VIILQGIGFVDAVLLQRVGLARPVLLQLLRVTAVLGVTRPECAVTIRKTAAVANAAITAPAKPRVAAAIHEAAIAETAAGEATAAETAAIEAAAKTAAPETTTAEPGRNLIERYRGKHDDHRAGQRRSDQLFRERD
jgi:hypothetical protein